MHMRAPQVDLATSEIPLDQVESEQQFFWQGAEMPKLAVLGCFEKKTIF